MPRWSEVRILPFKCNKKAPILKASGFFCARLIHWKELNRHHKDSPMAATKKKPASKKPAAKKTDSPGFFPKVRSTKKNGLGSY